MIADQEGSLKLMVNYLISSRMEMFDAWIQTCVTKNNRKLTGKGFTAPPWVIQALAFIVRTNLMSHNALFIALDTSECSSNLAQSWIFSLDTVECERDTKRPVVRPDPNISWKEWPPRRLNMILFANVEPQGYSTRIHEQVR